MKIGFAGLSHLGIITSIVSAAKGCNVIAYGDYFELKKINSNKINIKGKSTDGLGFIGKNKGISALAICSIYKKQ